MLVYFGEKARMKESLEKMKVYTQIAVDGEKDRFKAEKCAKEWKAGTTLKARRRQVGDKLSERIKQLPRGIPEQKAATNERGASFETKNKHHDLAQSCARDQRVARKRSGRTRRAARAGTRWLKDAREESSFAGSLVAPDDIFTPHPLRSCPKRSVCCIV